MSREPLPLNDAHFALDMKILFEDFYSNNALSSKIDVHKIEWKLKRVGMIFEDETVGMAF